MCSIIVFAICGFAISFAVGEPIRLDLLRRSGTDYQDMADCLGEGYVAGADEVQHDPPGTDAERADKVCTFLGVSDFPTIVFSGASLGCRYVYNRGTQRECSSKPLKHSIVKRILVFEW